MHPLAATPNRPPLDSTGFCFFAVAASEGGTPTNAPMEETVTQRARRFDEDADTKTQRDAQKGKESRRSSAAFFTKTAKPKHPMTTYCCDICGLTFGTTWLDHCPSCGSRSLSIVIELSMLDAQEIGL